MTGGLNKIDIKKRPLRFKIALRNSKILNNEKNHNHIRLFIKHYSYVVDWLFEDYYEFLKNID